MKKLLIFKTIFLVSFALVFSNQIAGAEDSYGVKSLENLMKGFVLASRPNRSIGTPGHDGAYKFLKSKFQALEKKYNGKLYEHSFRPDVDFAVKNYQNDL